MKKLILSVGLILSAIAFAVTPDKMPPLPDGAFTFAVIPDTQGYDGEGRHTKRGRAPGVGPTTNRQLDRIVDWLLANAEKENIRFVAHTGDLTDMNNDPQWAFASNALARIDGKIPYAISPGNHDMESTGDTKMFKRYFPASRFTANGWYVGSYDGNSGSCCLFESGKEKFVVVTLPCDAPDDAVAWADEQLTKYADRHAIISTHRDLGMKDEKNTRKFTKDAAAMKKEGRNFEKEYKPDTTLLGRMTWHKRYGKRGNSGVDLWKKLYSRHANIFLVVSGDQGQVKVTRVDEKGVNGNMVHSIMQDTGRGLIRIFRFIPAEKRIACYTIDPGHGGAVVHDCWCWHDDALFNFELPYPASVEAR